MDGLNQEEVVKRRPNPPRKTVSLSLNDREAELVDTGMKRHNFFQRATFIKWIINTFLKKEGNL